MSSRQRRFARPSPRPEYSIPASCAPPYCPRGLAAVRRPTDGRGFPPQPRGLSAVRKRRCVPRTARRLSPATSRPSRGGSVTGRPTDSVKVPSRNLAACWRCGSNATSRGRRGGSPPSPRGPAAAGRSRGGEGRRGVEVPPRVIAACWWCGGDAASPGRCGGSPWIHARPGGGDRETRVQRDDSSYQVMAFALSPWWCYGILYP